MEKLESVGNEKYLSVTERYFTQRYYRNTSREGEDVCILGHSNKICVICLAENHPICRENKKAVSVDYQFDNVNRLCNSVSGKGKKGGQNLQAQSLLCRITCDDGTQYYVPCGVKCQLLETNDSLKRDPSLLNTKPLSDGYIAIVLPKLKDYKEVMNSLLDKEEFVAINIT